MVRTQPIRQRDGQTQEAVSSEYTAAKGNGVGFLAIILAFPWGTYYNNLVCKYGKEGNHNAIGLHY